jgi:imidazole glycerol-phosphate synthase subunit HisF
MLTKRIIPCLDVRNGRVVKGKKFTDIVDVDVPEVLGAFYSECGADELVFYDITASHEARQTSLEFVEKVAKTINIPFSVGGGVNTIADFANVLRLGADKVSINSAAVRNPNLIADAALKYGSQCVVLSIDARQTDNGKWTVVINGGRIETGLDAIAWAKQGVSLGAGELVINSIDSDGVKEGYDIALLKAIANEVNVPVIASGGAGTKAHFAEAVTEANVDGILAASVFHFGEIPISELKSYLRDEGIEVRV